MTFRFEEARDLPSRQSVWVTCHVVESMCRHADDMRIPIYDRQQTDSTLPPLSCMLKKGVLVTKAGSNWAENAICAVKHALGAPSIPPIYFDLNAADILSKKHVQVRIIMLLS